MHTLLESHFMHQAAQLRREADCKRAIAKAQSPIVKRLLDYPLDDYRLALLRKGPIAELWMEFPEQVVCDLIAAVSYYAELAKQDLGMREAASVGP